MRIVVGSDDRITLTSAVMAEVGSRGMELELFDALAPGDGPAWPQVAVAVAQEVAQGRCHQGILFCYTGTGVSIAANKVPGVRAALCADAETARGARLWNDANVLCMSLRLTYIDVAREILDAWFSIPETDAPELGNLAWVNELDSHAKELAQGP